MQFRSVLKQGEQFVTDNSPAILTAIGVTGTITTAVLTGRASVKAAELIREAERVDDDILDNKEKFKLVWMLYIPPVGTGTITVAAIIFANRIGTRRAAAMATAYAVSEKAFAEYKDKVVEKLSANKEQKIRDEIAQDRVRKNPPSSEMLVLGSDESIFYDKQTGRYFKSTMEDVKKAQNHLNHIIINTGYASLNDFYSWVGLNAIPLGEEIGWSSDQLLELHFSATITEEDKPCIVVEFQAEPIRNYYKVHGR